MQGRILVIVLACIATLGHAVTLENIEKYLRDLEFPEAVDIEVNDRGYVENCGDKGDNLTIWWEPKDISKSGPVKGQIDMTAPVSWTSGNIKISVKLGEFQVFSRTLPGDCAKVHQYLPCPIKQGQQISRDFNIEKLPGQVPSGHTFGFRVEVSNLQSQQLMCAEGKVKIVH